MSSSRDWVHKYEELESDVPSTADTTEKNSFTSESQPMLEDATTHPTEPSTPIPSPTLDTLPTPTTDASYDTPLSRPQTASKVLDKPVTQKPPFFTQLSDTTNDSTSSSSQASYPQQQQQRPLSLSSKAYMPSPLNPSSSTPPYNTPFSTRRVSSMGVAHLRQMPSEDSRVLSGVFAYPYPQQQQIQQQSARGSMILYRWASSDEALAPPKMTHLNRESMISSSGDSVISVSSDSKYPAANGNGGERGLVPYAYDPEDDLEPDNEPDFLHDPSLPTKSHIALPWRGFFNISMLVLMLTTIITLFVVYPVVQRIHNNGVEQKIVGNTRINATGQAASEDVPVRRSLVPLIPFPIDPLTPSSANTLKVSETLSYHLLFSSEFTGGDNSDSTSDASTNLDLNGPRILARRSSRPSGSQFNSLNSNSPPPRGVLVRTLCLINGFLELGVKGSSSTDDDAPTRLFWTGDWIMAATGSLAPQSISEESSLSKAITVDVIMDVEDLVTDSTPPPSLLPTLDYLRVYGQRSIDDHECHLAESKEIRLPPDLFSYS